MPGPVIYVAAAISTVAVIIVLKEVCAFWTLLVYITHLTMRPVSSYLILMSVQGSLPGGRMSPVDADELDSRNMVSPQHHHSLLKVIMNPGRLLSEAPKARRNNLNDQLEPSIRRTLTYSIWFQVN